jgi:hypothetical protein
LRKLSLSFPCFLREVYYFPRKNTKPNGIKYDYDGENKKNNEKPKKLNKYGKREYIIQC